MKKISLLAILVMLMSCESEGPLTEQSVGDLPITQESILKFSGEFYPTEGISVQGAAKIYLDAGTNKLKLEQFQTSPGPDLKVYLSKTASPDEFINLGPLGNDSLNTAYTIPPNVEISDYPFVLIHCQQYNHLYAIAPLTAI